MAAARPHLNHWFTLRSYTPAGAFSPQDHCMHSLISPSTVQSAARDHAGPHLPTALLTTLFRTLAAALPLDGATPEIAAETFQAACALFAASQPGDAMAAAAATRAVAAH